MDNSLLTLQAVCKTFGAGASEVRALRSVSLNVDRGEVVAIMGPSGSGKSTLLTIAGGLEYPTSGCVVVAGEDISEFSAKQRASFRRQTIGFVFQEFNLLGGLTALENVAMPLELAGVTARVANAQAMDVLDTVGLTHREKSFPDDLSGGERQRVAIARAIIGNRRMLLADEPTGALDSANSESVMRVLRSASDQGKGVVMVTHDAHLAAWADRVVFIRDGAIVSQTNVEGPESLLPDAVAP